MCTIRRPTSYGGPWQKPVTHRHAFQGQPEIIDENGEDNVCMWACHSSARASLAETVHKGTQRSITLFPMVRRYYTRRSRAAGACSSLSSLSGLEHSDLLLQYVHPRPPANSSYLPSFVLDLAETREMRQGCQTCTTYIDIGEINAFLPTMLQPLGKVFGLFGKIRIAFLISVLVAALSYSEISYS
jgi:hypothetical protein